jgi:hypothetical protein
MVTMPTTPGSYEFPLFPDNRYTRAATSPTVTVRAATFKTRIEWRLQ